MYVAAIFCFYFLVNDEYDRLLKRYYEEFPEDDEQQQNSEDENDEEKKNLTDKEEGKSDRFEDLENPTDC